MINDCNFSYEILASFMHNEAKDFFLPQCEKNGRSIDEYARKLARYGTIVSQFDGDKIEGVVMGYTHDTPDRMSYIAQVFICPEYRNRHIAQTLLTEYLNYCRELGLKGCWLTTCSDNAAAVRLYYKLGFSIEYDNGELVRLTLTL